MKKVSWQLVLGVGLVFLSAVFYFCHYLLFRDSHHIFIYLIGDIAFVPVEVLLVTLIIHRVLGVYEKRSKMKKMNMVIGVFFSEAGTWLLRDFVKFDHNADSVRENFIEIDDWSDGSFLRFKKLISDYQMKVEPNTEDLEELKKVLSDKRDFFVRLLENPNLLEHDSFTNLLWSVFHLAEELGHREQLGTLSSADYAHLKGDIRRVYRRLIIEWVNYTGHLRKSYPYLFSLSMRLNPFKTETAVQFE